MNVSKAERMRHGALLGVEIVEVVQFAQVSAQVNGIQRL